MKKSRLSTRLCVALGALGILAVAGCELAVDFDRTKVDSGTFDASMFDASTTDAPVLTDAQGDTGDADTDAAIDDAGDGATTADADDAGDGADE